MKFTKFALSIILVLFLASNVFAKTYYVNAAGSDYNNGTSSQTPWQTINKILVGLFLASNIITKIYYVDLTGSDNNNGTSPQTPWQTINKVNTSSFSPGDSILFKKGEVWREQLNVPSSGSSGNVITFGTYSTGNTPTITAYDAITGWTANGGTDYTSDANMQAYYYLEEASGTRADPSNANDLTDNNTVTQSSTHKQGSYSALFTAANSESLSRTDANLSANFPGKGGSNGTAVTFGAWVNANTLGATKRGIIGKGAWGDGNCYSLLWHDGGVFQMLINDHGTGRYIEANSGTYNTGQWYHVVGRIEKNGSCNIFINGVKQTDTETYSNNNIGGGTSAFTIGRDLTWNKYWDGLIDEAFVFNRALSDAEIANICNKRLDGSLVGPSNYSKSLQLRPTRVKYDSTELTEVASLTALAAGKFYWSGSALYIYDNPSGHTVEAIARTAGIDLNNKGYITIDGIEVKGGQIVNLNDNLSKGGCIVVPMASSNITIKNCTLSRASNSGVHILAAAYVTVNNCDISEINGWDPINANKGGIMGDGIFVGPQNWGNPIPDAPNSITLTNNTIHDGCLRQGIAIVSGTNMTVTHNTISTGQIGIDLEPPTSKVFVDTVNIGYNTIHKSTLIMGPNPGGSNYNEGISVSGTCKNIIVEHNDIDLGGTNPSIGIWIAASLDSGNYTVQNNSVINANQPYRIGAGSTINSDNAVFRYNFAKLGFANGSNKVGLYVKAGSNSVNIYNNIFEGAFDSAIRFEDNCVATVYNNTLYGYVNGIDLASSYTANVTAKNNILYSAIASKHVIKSTGTTLVSDYNDFYPDGSSLFWYNNNSFNFLGLKTNSGFDSNSLTYDPRFANAARADFTLQSISPLRAAGANVHISRDYAGRAVHKTKPSIGSHQWMGKCAGVEEPKRISEIQDYRPNM